LAFSAALKPMPTVEAWVASAASKSTYLASAGDIAGTADILLRARLAVSDDGVSIAPQLQRLSLQADRVTLVGIAALMLTRFPPGWLMASVVNGQFITDFVPTDDMRRLEWLGPDLGPLILSVYSSLTGKADETLRKAIGDAGELAIMSALRGAGCAPVHVALASDAYGYDIEYTINANTRRLEVKSAVEATAGRLLVSRNEFDKAGTYASSWALVQVIFSSNVVVTRKITAADVISIRELSSFDLRKIAPPESENFVWLESAEFRPIDSKWITSRLRVDADFEVFLT
jgi:hypothetical protein